ncbi:hypothetical protein F2Q68_00001777 [Brassica cretica]|uniref:Uncharacterized protein n=1 Tax=Brassica cretica TaxID=69181 RepID=A0A8S9J770_BRACR|nr:hypothetical protein F2Q68_00001777 [Brassica cretica]
MNLSALDVLLCGALSFGLMIVNRLVWLGVVACLPLKFSGVEVPSQRVRIWGGYMFRIWSFLLGSSIGWYVGIYLLPLYGVRYQDEAMGSIFGSSLARM